MGEGEQEAGQLMRERLDTRLCNVIVEQAPDGIILGDREGIIRLWNPAAEALLGYSVDEAIGQTLDLIIPE